MRNKQIFVVVVYLLIFGGFGFTVGYSVCEDQQEGLYINYEELKSDYNILEIQYKRDLESCYTQLGDLQDRSNLCVH